MFKEYDIAWAKYQKTIKRLQLPLLSWDMLSLLQKELSHFNSLQKKWIAKENYLSKIANHCVIVTDENLVIQFVSQEITKLTGYNSSEIIGKSPKMFQGILTSKSTRNTIQNAIAKKHPFKEVILNYRKDGTTYWCEIEAYPKFDSRNRLVHYIAFEKKAS
jgi:PAS domain S-box-containing protein